MLLTPIGGAAGGGGGGAAAAASVLAILVALANVHLVCKDQQQCLFRNACIKLLIAVLSINSNARAGMWHC
jgi:hypothetical protein